MKILKGSAAPIKAWIDYVTLEPEAENQLLKLASLPFIYHHIAVMPDVHAGKGSTVGTVLATEGSIIPAAVGVDIGCGMMAVKLPFKIDQLNKMPTLRDAIESNVPVGFNYHAEPVNYLNSIEHLMREDVDKKVWLQLGTLGGGNHFIEISKDQHNDVWALVHSGSRGIGNKLAEKHIAQAKTLMKENFIRLPDPDLAYLAQGSKEFDAYIKDLLWAQDFAKYNRLTIMYLVLKAVSFHVYHEYRDLLKASSLIINCHHNYSQIEHHFGKAIWVTRKGAVSARNGEYGIIPGSMGDKSYIVRGKGNPESFCSCSHGAGRTMSRSRAKRIFSLKDLQKQTEGIECRKDRGVIDEIPAAYKNIDDVMKSQEDLVEAVFTLNQVICVKG